jgi:predicted Zn-dependent protease with MMP-like domain
MQQGDRDAAAVDRQACSDHAPGQGIDQLDRAADLEGAAAEPCAYRLYRRAARTQKSGPDAPMENDTITLYRGPILLEWIETGEDLFRLIRTVLIQEIAHHFGWSDADIERLERDE